MEIEIAFTQESCYYSQTIAEKSEIESAKPFCIDYSESESSTRFLPLYLTAPIQDWAVGETGCPKIKRFVKTTGFGDDSPQGN